MSSIRERLCAVISEQLGIPAAIVKDNDSIIDDLKADSLDKVDLIGACEEEFNIEIPDKDAECLHTVGEFVTYIESRL